MDDEISSPEDLEDDFGDIEEVKTATHCNIVKDDVNDNQLYESVKTNIKPEKIKNSEEDACDIESRTEICKTTSQNNILTSESKIIGREKIIPLSTSHYSSSSDDVISSIKDNSQVKRRKKRKRPVGENERKIRLKSAMIEKALRDGDKDKLGQLSVSEGGLLTDEVRVRVWPRLLGINMLETVTVLPTDEELSRHAEYNQVVLDVNRSLKRFPPGIDEADRPLLQDQLTRLIVRVLMAQPSLHYYQGYHDVAITFLLVVGEHIGFQIMEKLSVSHLQKFMAPSMEQTMGLLQLMYPIIRISCPPLHEHLIQSELGTIFALPWLITWFGHVLPDYSDVVRLYDFFLAGPPLMPVYLATAIVLHRKDEILATDCEMSSVHGLLSRIPVNLPFEELLVSSQQLYEKYPPYSIEKEAALDLTKQKEERERGRNPPALPGKTYRQVLTRIVIYGAPVLLGVVVWRICMQG